MVLIDKFSKIVTGHSSANSVYKAHQNTQLGIKGKLDLTPKDHMDWLTNYANTAIGNSKTIGEEDLRKLRYEAQHISEVAKLQKKYFGESEKIAGSHVDMVLEQMAHQQRMMTLSTRLANGQYRTIERAADIAHNNMMAYQGHKAKMDVYARSRNIAQNLF